MKKGLKKKKKTQQKTTHQQQPPQTNKNDRHQPSKTPHTFVDDII